MYNLFINRVLGLSCKMMKNVCHCQCYVGLFKVKLKSGTVDTRTIKLRYVTARAHPWSCLLERYEGNIPPFGKLFWQTQNNWTAHTFHTCVARTGCSSPSIKELHGAPMNFTLYLPEKQTLFITKWEWFLYIWLKGFFLASASQVKSCSFFQMTSSSFWFEVI